MVPFDQEEEKLTEETQAAEEIAEDTTQEAENGFYRGVGVGQKESPFANSPYVTYHPDPEEPVSEQAPAEPKAHTKEDKPKKKVGWTIFKGITSALLVIALLVTSCTLTAVLGGIYWNTQWSEQYNTMLQNMTEKHNALQNQFDALQDKVAIGGGQLETPAGTLTADQIYQRNAHSVVALTCVVMRDGAASTSAGTGFVMREDGYIITNYHVVEGATQVTVTLANGTNHPAQIIGADASNDVALIKINVIGLPAVTIGSSSNMKVGDQVVAIGNALGELSASLTVGYVSGINRTVRTDGSVIHMLQTDVAINSGNSGGPLFNARGEVIGITTAKYSGTTPSGATIEGISFAIPIDDVLPILEDLRDFGYIRQGYLGVYAQDVDQNAAEHYGIPMGAYIQNVVPGGCAAAAGIQAKDIILELGGYKVTCMNDLGRALRQFEPGDTVTVKLWRGGREILVTVTLDEKPQT